MRMLRKCIIVFLWGGLVVSIGAAPTTERYEDLLFKGDLVDEKDPKETSAREKRDMVPCLSTINGYGLCQESLFTSGSSNSYEQKYSYNQRPANNGQGTIYNQQPWYQHIYSEPYDMLESQTTYSPLNPQSIFTDQFVVIITPTVIRPQEESVNPSSSTDVPSHTTEDSSKTGTPNVVNTEGPKNTSQSIPEDKSKEKTSPDVNPKPAINFNEIEKIFKAIDDISNNVTDVLSQAVHLQQKIKESASLPPNVTSDANNTDLRQLKEVFLKIDEVAANISSVVSAFVENQRSNHSIILSDNNTTAVGVTEISADTAREEVRFTSDKTNATAKSNKTTGTQVKGTGNSQKENPEVPQTQSLPEKTRENDTSSIHAPTNSSTSEEQIDRIEQKTDQLVSSVNKLADILDSLEKHNVPEKNHKENDIISTTGPSKNVSKTTLENVVNATVPVSEELARVAKNNSKSSNDTENGSEKVASSDEPNNGTVAPSSSVTNEMNTQTNLTAYIETIVVKLNKLPEKAENIDPKIVKEAPDFSVGLSELSDTALVDRLIAKTYKLIKSGIQTSNLEKLTALRQDKNSDVEITTTVEAIKAGADGDNLDENILKEDLSDFRNLVDVLYEKGVSKEEIDNLNKKVDDVKSYDITVILSYITDSTSTEAGRSKREVDNNGKTLYAELYDTIYNVIKNDYDNASVDVFIKKVDKLSEGLILRGDNVEDIFETIRQIVTEIVESNAAQEREVRHGVIEIPKNDLNHIMEKMYRDDMYDKSINA